MTVQAIGGLFIRAQNPEAMSNWYRDHLHVGAGCVADGAGEAQEWVWMTQGGPVVFAPFKMSSDYFPMDKSFMVNFRVSGLDLLIEKLKAAGIAVRIKPEWDDAGMGKFARIHDPEGNPIELWEPAS